jgi:hypothetical protein
MARYRIELIDRSDKPGGSGITNRQECDLASDEEAIQRAEEFYRAHETSVIGYRVIDVTTSTTVCRFRH